MRLYRPSARRAARTTSWAAQGSTRVPMDALTCASTSGRMQASWATWSRTSTSTRSRDALCCFRSTSPKVSRPHH